ncbi:MAG: NOL1/NOP2/sun family putative RNA methylase [Promethearchaeota archaeon]
MKPVIPDRFKERYGQLVDDEEAFFTSLFRLLPKSFRVNTLKTKSKIINERFENYGITIKQVPWYPDAFVSEDNAIGSTLENFIGYIYIQELTSMLPPLVLKEQLQSANFVLDSCAAPGSKTTQLAALMENRGTIVANDINYNRIRALKFNIEKTGTLNTVITNWDLRFFPKNEFDIILVDAPCSSEGTIRKNPTMLSKWTGKRIPGYANLQQQLIVKAFDLLKPSGYLVYSTCTFAPEENEGVVDWLLERRAATLEQITIPRMKLMPGVLEWNGTTFNQELRKTIRIWPHHNDTDGFFLAKVRK